MQGFMQFMPMKHRFSTPQECPSFIILSLRHTQTYTVRLHYPKDRDCSLLRNARSYVIHLASYPEKLLKLELKKYETIKQKGLHYTNSTSRSLNAYYRNKVDSIFRPHLNTYP
jgi:hypothetical protein